MLRIDLKKGEDRRVRDGHPWVFSNEMREVRGVRTPGVAAEIFDAGGGYVGTGYYNPHSLIAARILSRSREDIDGSDFIRNRLEQAVRYRAGMVADGDSYRVVYGESDFLPGLVVDRYGDYLSVQILTAGMEARREVIVRELVALFQPRGIIGRNDVAVRKLEGLPEVVETLFGNVPESLVVHEHGLKLPVDLAGGQKTGHFLDQRENHLLLKGISSGASVLDCFCYSGSWGVHAATYGAREVLCLDVSARAVSLVRRNAELNDVADRVTAEECDAFDRLRTLKGEGRRFDVVVMDPPAFIKSRKHLKEGIKGYLTVNRRAMELLAPGGILITCSCSFHMDRELFRDTVARAAAQAGRPMRLLKTASQGADHPVLLSVPETEYLKCLVLQAVE